MCEVWKDIKDYEGLYQVSNIGNVKRVKDQEILTQSNTAGYKEIRLNKNKKHCTLLVHRLVAIAFIPNPNNYPCINHKDETRDNNNVDNLEWCTHKYNSNYGTAQQRREERRLCTMANKPKPIKIMKHVLNTEKQWGGARAGAGRKPTGRIRKTLWVTEEELLKIKELLKKWRIK